MEINEYQKGAMSTCMLTSHNYTYMAEGLVGEVGEFMSKTAKAIRKDYMTIVYNQPFLKDEFKEEFYDGLKGELGDILWFVAGLADVLGWTLEEVAQANIDKLASRQKRGVIEGNGDNR